MRTQRTQTAETDALAHEQTIRSVARRYLADANDVDDVVQETWLVGLRDTLRVRHNPRAWFAEVARRVALSVCSTRTRRSFQASELDELRAREPGKGEEQVFLLARLERLREPYRSTIWLRYYEDLAPRHIAQHMDVPVETVRTRLRRGLDELQRDLADEYADRYRATGVLATLWLALRSRFTSPAGATFGAAFCASLLVVAGGWMAWSAPAGAAAGGGVEPRLPWAAPGDLTTAVVAPDAEDPESQAGARVPVAASSTSRRVAGIAIGATGRPVEGARVFVQRGGKQPPSQVGSTDGTGAFEFGLGAGWRSVWVEGEGTTSAEVLLVRAGSLGGRGFEFRLVPVHTVQGRITDTRGEPIAGAVVQTSLTANYYERRTAGSPGTDWAKLAWSRTETGPDGAFELGGLPQLPASLVVKHAEFVEERRLALQPDGFEVVLLRPTSLRVSLADAAGQPVHGASLELGREVLSRVARADETPGGWQLTGLMPGKTYSLTVRAPGFGSRMETFVAPETGAGEFTLVLTRPVEVSGVVLGVGGEPQPGAIVQALQHASAPVFGAADPRKAGAPQLGVIGSAVTDSSGRFEIADLSDVELELRATPVAAERAAVARRRLPGESFLVLQTAPTPESHVCRVVDALTGAPVAAARVAIGDRARGTVPVEVATSSSGAFDLSTVAADESLVTVWSEQHATSIVTAERARERGTIVLYPRLTTRVWIRDRAGRSLEQGFVQLLDLDGEPVLTGLEHGKFADTLTIAPGGYVELRGAPRRALRLRVIPGRLAAAEEHALDLATGAAEYTIDLAQLDLAEPTRRVVLELDGPEHVLGKAFQVEARTAAGRLVSEFSASRTSWGWAVDDQVVSHLAMYNSNALSVRTYHLGGREHVTALRGLDPYGPGTALELELPEQACRVLVRTDEGATLAAGLPAGSGSARVTEFELQTSADSGTR